MKTTQKRIQMSKFDLKQLKTIQNGQTWHKIN